MPIKITMPALSPTMEEGNMGQWFKSEGDPVESGELLAEIETDKATMELEAIDDGTLAKIVVPSGTENVPVNAVIAVVLEEGEDASALEGLDLSAPAAAAAPAAPAPPAEPAAAAEPSPEAPPAPAGAPEVQAAPAPAAPPRAAGERIKASPLARRMAAQAGLDLAAIAGSGPNGRIVKADIETAMAGGIAAAPAAAPAPPAAAPAPPRAALAPVPGAASTPVPHTPMRKAIAKRLLLSKQTVPHFYLTIDCAIDKLLSVRAELNARDDVEKLSVNDFVIRAVALALSKVPEANASWTDDAILLHSTVDVSVAVAMEDGLITPIVFNADAKGLSQISAEVKDLAARARAEPLGLEPHEYQGGTITISNLGMYGIRQFDAIINPPQGCILAVGAGEQRPVVIDGALAIATVMTCTLSCDHRVVDGAVGAGFLGAFKALVEDPLAMLL